MHNEANNDYYSHRGYMEMYRARRNRITGLINREGIKFAGSFFFPREPRRGPNYRLIPRFPAEMDFLTRSSFSDARRVIKDRSHVRPSRLSIVQRSSRVSRFSHKTRPTTFDRCQSTIIIVLGDVRRIEPRSPHDRARSCYPANPRLFRPPSIAP